MIRGVLEMVLPASYVVVEEPVVEAEEITEVTE